MTPLNVLRTAFRSLSANKLRVALTALGIIIGVASVIAMLALGNGARAAVDANFRFLGSDIVQVSVKRELEQEGGELIPVGQILSYHDGLQMAKAVELVSRAEMSVSGAAKARYDRAVLDMLATGATATALESLVNRSQVQPVEWTDGDLLNALAFVDRGRFFTPLEVLQGSDVCVLGHKTASDLLGGVDPLDEVIWVNRHRCLVIGVITELEVTNPTMRNRLRPNEALYLPISTAVRNLYDEEPSVTIVARVVDESRMGEAKAQIATFLRERHAVEKDAGGEYEDDFEMTTRQDILGAQQDAARTFGFLLTAMAVVSLVVGGIGIMNVMLVSITERTREIGVRRAVGAQRWDIVAQFLSEAVLISSGGGVLGVSVGILAIPLAASLNRGVALLAPYSIPLGFGVSVLAGVLFGLYPAVRASRLDPIEALRYE